MSIQLKKSVKAKLLEDHLMNFLAGNGEAGFELDGVIFKEVIRPERARIRSLNGSILLEVMMLLKEYDHVPHTIIKDYAWRLKDASNGVLKHNYVLNVLSLMFGYRSHNGLAHAGYPGLTREEREVAKETDEERMIPNRRDKSSIDLSLFTLNDHQPTNFWLEVRSDVDELLKAAQ